MKICPVCNGKGQLPMGFYLDEVNSTGTLPYTICRTCYGRGIISTDDKASGLSREDVDDEEKISI